MPQLFKTQPQHPCIPLRRKWRRPKRSSFRWRAPRSWTTRGCYGKNGSRSRNPRQRNSRGLLRETRFAMKTPCSANDRWPRPSLHQSASQSRLRRNSRGKLRATRFAATMRFFAKNQRRRLKLTLNQSQNPSLRRNIYLHLKKLQSPRLRLFSRRSNTRRSCSRRKQS